MTVSSNFGMERILIQKGLWRDNLNPETSSWSKVVAQAEIIEISENVVDQQDRRNNSNQRGHGSQQVNTRARTEADLLDKHQGLLLMTTDLRSIRSLVATCNNRLRACRLIQKEQQI